MCYYLSPLVVTILYRRGLLTGQDGPAYLMKVVSIAVGIYYLAHFTRGILTLLLLPSSFYQRYIYTFSITQLIFVRYTYSCHHTIIVTTLSLSPLYHCHHSIIVTTLLLSPLYHCHHSVIVITLSLSLLYHCHHSLIVTTLLLAPLYNFYYSILQVLVECQMLPIKFLLPIYDKFKMAPCRQPLFLNMTLASHIGLLTIHSRTKGNEYTL